METYRNKTVIFFDGVCNFCNSSINLVIRNDKHNRFLFAPLQSTAGQEFLKTHQLETKDFDSIVVFDQNKVFRKSTAALVIVKRMGFPWSLLYPLIIFPSFLRDPFYNFIARNRYRFFGKKEVCMVPTPEVRAKFLS